MGAGESRLPCGADALALAAKHPDGSDLEDFESARTEVIKLRAALVKATQKKSTADRECHIIAFNDVYNLNPMHKNEPVGGICRFATVLAELAHDIHPAKPLILFSGDFVGPSLMSTVTKGAHLVEVLNTLGVHFGTFGNHEFDYGYESLKRRLDGVDDDVQHGDDPIDYPESETQWLCTNITEAATGLPCGGDKVKRSALIDWDGVKLGLLAVSEDWLSGCSQLKEGELIYEDFVESARRTARELKLNGAEVVVALTHNRLANDRLLKDSVSEIDLLLGGHDHFYKYDRRRRVLKAGEEFRWVNHIVVEIEGDGRRDIHVSRYDVDGEIEEDASMKSVVSKYEAIERLKFGGVVGRTAVDLDATEKCVRFGEGTLPNWVCDAVSEDYSKLEGLQSADISFIPGFVFAGKKVFQKGDVTLGTIMEIFPKPCRILVVVLKGSEVVKSLERGCRSLPGECGGLHHCNSRLMYTVDLHATPRVSASEVFFDGKPIDLDRTFHVAITDAMATGKHGFVWYKSAERIVDEEYAMQIQDLLLMYLERHKGETINPKMGRIHVDKSFM